MHDTVAKRALRLLGVRLHAVTWTIWLINQGQDKEEILIIYLGHIAPWFKGCKRYSHLNFKWFFVNFCTIFYFHRVQFYLFFSYFIVKRLSYTPQKRNPFSVIFVSYFLTLIFYSFVNYP